MGRMKNLTIEKIAEVTGGEIIGEYSGIAGREVRGVVINSKLVEEDFVFIAAKGEQVDGHNYIPQAFAQGAMFVICDHVVEDMPGPCIFVEKSYDALRAVAAYYRSCLDVKFVGVTGSVGKTTTREFITSVLQQKYNVHSTRGNFNNEIGVPLTLLQVYEEHEVAVVEMGINHFGEMSRLTQMVHPDVSIMTNIGYCHLENLGDRDGVLRAKSEIFEGMNEDGILFVNGDDDKLRTLQKVCGKAPVRYGVEDAAGKNSSGQRLSEGASSRETEEEGSALDYYASEIKRMGIRGSRVRIRGKDGTDLRVTVPLPGTHMIYNAVAATAIGKHFGLSVWEIKAGLEKCQAVSGRSNIIDLKDVILIDDCYNANPNSMRAALDVLSYADNRKIAILGDMFELGAQEKQLHAQMGAYAVEKGVDVLICIGGLSKNMKEAAERARFGKMGNFVEIHWFATLEEFLERLTGLIRKDSTVLVKASHGMQFDKIVKEMLAKFI